MKKTIMTVLLSVLTISSQANAGATFLSQGAIGGWYASTSGDVGYKSSGDINLEDDLGYDESTSIEGWVKAYLPIIPNIYVMGAAVNMDEKVENPGIAGPSFIPPLSSEMNINQYDATLFWELPFLGAVSLGNLRLEGGFNMRLIDTEIEIKDATHKASKDTQTWVPMLYAGAGIGLGAGFTVEAEVKASSYDDQQWFSGIARIKQDIAHILFISGGYRYDDIDMDTDGLRLDTEIKGPFLEVGFFL